MDFEWSGTVPRLPISPPRAARALNKIEVIVNAMSRKREEPAWMGRSNLRALRKRREQGAAAAAAAANNTTASRGRSKSRRKASGRSSSRRKGTTTRKPRNIGQLF